MWGNHRRVHYLEAIAEAEANDELLVSLDDVLVVNEGSQAAVAIHIVAEPNFWEKDEPKGYCVQLVRPHWLYGSEGHLFPLRWVGHMDEITMEEIESHPDKDPVWEALPENSSYLWAIPRVSSRAENAQPWKRCEQPWFDSFRQAR